MSVGKDLEAVLRKFEYWHQVVIIKFTIMARGDTALIFKSVFFIDSRIATSSLRCWKFVQTNKGASLITFPPLP
jgi:hypothetical protein